MRDIINDIFFYITIIPIRKFLRRTLVWIAVEERWNGFQSEVFAFDPDRLCVISYKNYIDRNEGTKEIAINEAIHCISEGLSGCDYPVFSIMTKRDLLLMAWCCIIKKEYSPKIQDFVKS